MTSTRLSKLSFCSGTAGAPDLELEEVWVVPASVAVEAPLMDGPGVEASL